MEIGVTEFEAEHEEKIDDDQNPEVFKLGDEGAEEEVVDGVAEESYFGGKAASEIAPRGDEELSDEKDDGDEEFREH